MRIGRVFGPKTEEVDKIGGYRKLHNEELTYVILLPKYGYDIIREDEVGGACSTGGR
jgi:hypothetical protein